MAIWDIARLRELAGQPIVESYDDDDDDGLSASERALASKADSDLKKKGVKVAKVDPDKDLHALAQRRKAKEEKKEAATDEEEKKAAAAAKAEKEADEKNAPKADDDEKPAEKKEDKSAEKPAEKKEDKPAEKKQRGKKPDANSKAQRALAWIKANPDAGGGAFAKWAAANIDMGKNYANTYFHGLKAKARAQLKATANECYMISHPWLSTHFLYEDKAMNQMQWIDIEGTDTPTIFESKEAAENTMKYLADWKHQGSKLVHVNLED